MPATRLAADRSTESSRRVAAVGLASGAGVGIAGFCALGAPRADANADGAFRNPPSKGVLTERFRLPRHGLSRASSEQVPHAFRGLQGHGSPVGAAVEEESARGSAVEVDGAIHPPRRQDVRQSANVPELGEGESARGHTDDPVQNS